MNEYLLLKICLDCTMIGLETEQEVRRLVFVECVQEDNSSPSVLPSQVLAATIWLFLAAVALVVVVEDEEEEES